MNIGEGHNLIQGDVVRFTYGDDIHVGNILKMYHNNENKITGIKVNWTIGRKSKTSVDGFLIPSHKFDEVTVRKEVVDDLPISSTENNTDAGSNVKEPPRLKRTKSSDEENVIISITTRKHIKDLGPGKNRIKDRSFTQWGSVMKYLSYENKTYAHTCLPDDAQVSLNKINKLEILKTVSKKKPIHVFWFGFGLKINTGTAISFGNNMLDKIDRYDIMFNRPNEDYVRCTRKKFKQGKKVNVPVGDISFCHDVKHAMVGPSRVGKTKIAYWARNGKPDDMESRYKHHIRPYPDFDFFIKYISIGDHTAVTQLWDLGADRDEYDDKIYLDNIKTIVPKCDSILLVYDICDEKSFDRATDFFYPMAKELAPDAVFTLIGNNLDMTLYKDRQVEFNVAKECFCFNVFAHSFFSC